jgi:hypothetical protein
MPPGDGTPRCLLLPRVTRVHGTHRTPRSLFLFWPFIPFLILYPQFPSSHLLPAESTRGGGSHGRSLPTRARASASARWQLRRRGGEYGAKATELRHVDSATGWAPEPPAGIERSVSLHRCHQGRAELVADFWPAHYLRHR